MLAFPIGPDPLAAPGPGCTEGSPQKGAYATRLARVSQPRLCGRRPRHASPGPPMPAVVIMRRLGPRVLQREVSQRCGRSGSTGMAFSIVSPIPGAIPQAVHTHGAALLQLYACTDEAQQVARDALLAPAQV